jgi:hypothetical protein
MTRHQRLQHTMRSPQRKARRAKAQRRHLRNHALMWDAGSWCEGRHDHRINALDFRQLVWRRSA